jgi:hypothetical protein
VESEHSEFHRPSQRSVLRPPTSVLRSRPQATAGHSRSEWRRVFEMAVASLLAEAVANFLPARAPGVPAWPSSFRVFRDFRGCSVIASAPLCSGMLTRSFPLVSPLRGRLRLSPESGYPCRLGALPGPYIRLMLTRSSHSSRPCRAAFGSLPCGCPHRLGPLGSALARGCSAFSSAIRFCREATHCSRHQRSNELLDLVSVLSYPSSVIGQRPNPRVC